jgi:hypothetical protein
MANVNVSISVTFKPAFHALVECAQVIADEQGDEVASQWAKKVLEADWNLFCGTQIDRPRLRLIQGGR